MTPFQTILSDLAQNSWVSNNIWVLVMSKYVPKNTQWFS